MRTKTAGLIFLIAPLLAGSLTAASITVSTEPCLIVKGKDCTITWNSYGAMADRVNLTVWHGAGQVTQFNNLPNTVGGENTHVWPVPASAATGTYKFRVTTIDGLVQGECEHPVNAKGLFLTGPGPGAYLEIDTFFKLTWLGFGLPYSSSVSLDLYRSGALVGQIGESGMNTSWGCGYSDGWKVGHLLDPNTGEPAEETVPTGSGYFIRVRHIYGSEYSDTSQFTITQNFDWLRDKFSHMRRIPVIPVPPGGDPCPKCGLLQLEEFLEVMKSAPKRYEVELWASGRSLGRLLRSRQGNQSIQRIDFGASFPQLEKGGGGFELRVFDARGRLVRTQAVILALSRRAP